MTSACSASERSGALRGAELEEYLNESRALVLEQIRSMIPPDTPYGPILYDIMLDYPLRAAKALRPAICIATSRALGGRLEPVLPSAAVLELYHNAFLIHDDVEDRSEKRRDLPTLHEMYGIPIAVNVGDAMLALALSPLFDNMRTLGMGKALRVLRTIAVMARESAEGQAIELSWVRGGEFTRSDVDYLTMVEKKTAYYSFITPVAVGAIVAGAEQSRALELERFARLLGVAFQIQDDILNLVADEGRYGKEIGGDLWEGKHTLMLIHMMRSASDEERARALAILQKPRSASAVKLPSELLGARASAIAELLAVLEAQGELSAKGRAAIERELTESRNTPGGEGKSQEEVEFLFELIERYDSIAYARTVALERAHEAGEALGAMGSWLKPSVHRDFLGGLVEYVVQRDR